MFSHADPVTYSSSGQSLKLRRQRVPREPRACRHLTDRASVCLEGASAAKSARGAVPVFRLARLPGPLPEPAVPITEQRALRKPRCSGPCTRHRPSKERG